MQLTWWNSCSQCLSKKIHPGYTVRGPIAGLFQYLDTHSPPALRSQFSASSNSDRLKLTTSLQSQNHKQSTSTNLQLYLPLPCQLISSWNVACYFTCGKLQNEPGQHKTTVYYWWSWSRHRQVGGLLRTLLNKPPLVARCGTFSKESARKNINF